MEPWLIQPELTKERLIQVAKILKTVRDQTAELHDPDAGDGVWSLGCRIYERSINQLSVIAKTTDWLRILRENLFFIMVFEDIHVRFFRGEATNPTARTLRDTEPRLMQSDFGFVEGMKLWRISVDTNADGSTFRICIAQYDNEGNASNIWEIPLTSNITALGLTADTLPDAILIPSPEVKELEKESGVAARG